MRKRVDIAVYDNFTAAREGAWEPGVQVLGLAEGGLDWVLDGNNESLITPAMQEAAEAAEDAIVSGEVRSEEHTSELQSLMRISYAVLCLKKKSRHRTTTKTYNHHHK